MARRGIPADPPSLSPAQFYTGQASTPTRIRGRAGEAGERGRLGSQTEVVGSWGGSAGTDGNAVAGPSRERVASVGAGSAKRRARVGRSEPSRTKAGHADGGHTMADLKARKLAISRQIGKKWTGPISGPYIATLLGPDQTRADGKRYLSAGMYYVDPSAQSNVRSSTSLVAQSTLLPLPIGSAARELVEAKRDFGLPFNITKVRDTLIAKARDRPAFLATLPISAHKIVLPPAKPGPPPPAPVAPKPLKTDHIPNFADRYLEPDPSKGRDGKRFATHGIYWRDDGLGSATERAANTWRIKLGVDGLTREPLLPMPQGLGQYISMEQRPFGLPFDIMNDVHRLSSGRHCPPAPRQPPRRRREPKPRPQPQPQPQRELKSVRAPTKLATNQAKSVPLNRSTSKRSRSSATDLHRSAEVIAGRPGEKRFLTHGMYWSEDPRVRPAQRQANATKRDLSGLSPDEVDAQRLLPLPMGEGFLILAEEKDFSLPFDILRDFGKVDPVSDRTPTPEVQLEVPVEPGPEPVPAVKEIVRKPPPYKIINKNVFVGRGKDAEDHPAVCECKRPADPNEQGCGDSCLNRAMAITCNLNTCPCGKQCANKPFGQLSGVDKKDLSVFWTGNRGWGLKTLVDINKGDFIVEYCGEVISRAESYRRVLNEYKDWHAYYFLNYDGYEVIDAGLKGNCARYINHSCGPNVQVVSCKYADVDEFQIGVVATEDIKAGTELGYDYGWQNFADLRARADAAEQAICDASSTSSTHEASASASTAAEAIGELGRQRCFCGAAMCSGWLGKKVDKTKGGVAQAQALALNKKAKAKRVREPSAGPASSRVEAGVGQAPKVVVKTEKVETNAAKLGSSTLVPKKVSLLAFAAEAELASPPEHHFILGPVLCPSPGHWAVFACDMRPADVSATAHAEAGKAAAKEARHAKKAAAGLRSAKVGVPPAKVALPTSAVTDVARYESVSGEEPPVPVVVVKKVARVHPKKQRRV